MTFRQQTRISKERARSRERTHVPLYIFALHSSNVLQHNSVQRERAIAAHAAYFALHTFHARILSLPPLPTPDVTLEPLLPFLSPALTKSVHKSPPPGNYGAVAPSADGSGPLARGGGATNTNTSIRSISVGGPPGTDPKHPLLGGVGELFIQEEYGGENRGGAGGDHD